MYQFPEKFTIENRWLSYAGVSYDGIPYIPEELDEEITLFEPPADISTEIGAITGPLLTNISEELDEETTLFEPPKDVPLEFEESDESSSPSTTV